MVGRNGVAVARDGTRFTVDNDGRVYSDRMFRADNREAVRTAWIDHRERRQAEVVGGRFNRHVILSGDHGRTWRKAKLGDLDRVVAARYGAWKRGRQQARLEADRLRWQATGGKETHDSTWLARESIKSFRQREAAIFKGHLDWDVLAARNGVAYDRDGRRYTVDARGRVWSEALAKRSWAVEHSRAGREAAQAMQRHAHHAARYRMARHRVEKAIGDGQQRELDRLASMALSVADKRWRDAGRVETRDSAEMAREAVAAARRGHFDWNQAALERGVQYDRDGRRYATDNAGRLRVEALEKTAWHYQHDAAAREAHGRQDRARSTGPLAWWRDRKTSAALRQSVERERRSLEDMGGFPREQERTVRDAAREQSAARHAKRERQPRDRSR